MSAERRDDFPRSSTFAECIREAVEVVTNLERRLGSRAAVADVLISAVAEAASRASYPADETSRLVRIFIESNNELRAEGILRLPDMPRRGAA